DRGILVTVALVVSGVLVALVAVLLISRSISRPVADMVRTLTDAAGGDLTARSSHRIGGEMGEMGAAINRTLERTQEVVRTIGEASVTLAASAEQLVASANQVSGNVTTVAAGTHQLTASVSSIAAAADEARQVALAAVQQASGASHLIDELDASSREISGV